MANLNTRLLTFILFWSGLVIMCSLYMTIPLLSVFEAEFAVSSNQAAWAGSIFSIFFALGCFFFGIMAVRYGLKRVMVLGLALLFIITFITGTADSFNQLLIYRALQGVVAATFPPVALTYVGFVFPPERRGTAIGFISSGFLMAGIIGQLVSSLVEPLLNWHAVFYVFGIFYAVTVVAMLMILPKENVGKTEDLLSTIKKLSIPFKQKKIVILYCIAITILLSFVGMYTALGKHLAVNFGFDSQQIFLVRALGFFGIVLSPFTGKFAVRYSFEKVLNTGLVMSIVGLVFMGINNNLVLTIVMSVIFVAGVALIIPCLISLVGQLGGQNKGIATSIYTFLLFIGASLGPIIATFFMSAGNLKLPFTIFAVILAVAFTLSLFLNSIDSKMRNKKSA